MKKHTVFLRIVLFTIVSFLFTAELFGQNSAPTLAQFDWLVGTWQREAAKSVTVESWHKLSEHTFEGLSVRISKATQDTVFSESLLLAEMGGELFYVAKVPENAFPIPFKLTTFDENQAVFENAGHDFPQKITYLRHSATAMTVVVSGTENGQARQFEVKFQRK